MASVLLTLVTQPWIAGMVLVGSWKGDSMCIAHNKVSMSVQCRPGSGLLHLGVRLEFLACH